MTHTDLQAKVTKTGAFDGTGIDISGLPTATTDWTFVLEIMGLDSGDTAQFEIADSVDAFTNKVVRWSQGVKGEIGASSPKTDTGVAGASTGYFANIRKYSFKKADCPNIRFGTGSCTVRCSLTELTGSSPHVTYQSWFEY